MGAFESSKCHSIHCQIFGRRKRMASMAVQTARFLGFLLLLILASEAAVVNRDGSGEGELPSDVPEVPELPGKDKNLRKIPPFGEPSLGEKEFDDFGVDNPEDYPLDYDDFSVPVATDYDEEEFLSPGKKPEKKPELKPGIDKDDRPLKENGGEEEDRNDDEEEGRKDDEEVDKKDDDEEVDKKDDDEEVDKKDDDEDRNDEEDKDNEIPRNDDEADKDFEIPKNPDEEEEEIPKNHDDEDDEVEDALDAEEDSDESLDSGKDDDESEEVPEEAGEPGETGLFHGGSIFDTPFFNVRQVTKYFQQLEKALGHVFRQTMEEAALLNGTYANTTEEEVDIDGKKYIVQKSIIKGKDNDSSIYVEALSTKTKTNDTKEDSGL